MSERAPAQPFVRAAAGSGFTAATLPVLDAWLQSDTVRDQHIFKLQVGSDLYQTMGGRPTYRVLATAANPDLYPTGERQSPQDDLTYTVEEQAALAPTEVWLLHQVPPGNPDPEPTPQTERTTQC